MPSIQTTTYDWTDSDGDDCELEVEFTITGSYSEGYSVNVLSVYDQTSNAWLVGCPAEDRGTPADGTDSWTPADQADLEGWLLDHFLPEDDA